MVNEFKAEMRKGVLNVDPIKIRKANGDLTIIAPSPSSITKAIKAYKEKQKKEEKIE